MIFQSELIKSLQLHADKIAIEYAGGVKTYAELLKDANKQTHFLLGENVEPATIIGIDITDRVQLISTIVAVANARCVFVLLDRSLPASRLEAVCKDLDLQHVISSDPQSFFHDTCEHVWMLEEMLDKHDEVPAFEYPDFDSEDSLYIYFTSGSTGTPKGIVGKNDSLLQFLQWEIAAFDIQENNRVSQFISPYFDAFLRDVFAPLLAGGSICIPPNEEDFFTPEKIIPWIDKTGVNLIHCVPSLFRVINDVSISSENFKALKYVLMSGEKIIPASLKGWYEVFEDRIKLVNLYGLTETTMIRSFYVISPKDVNKAKIPIGAPINDTEFLISKKDFKPCNTLIPGDLYIISDYVSKGYLNNPELTHEKFLKIPSEKYPNAKAVRTGDKARKLPNKNIELIGREDRQVKLRGIRIELDEIEARLAQSELLKNQVVIVHEDKGNESLLAFVIPQNESETAEELKTQLGAYLRENLPGYMIPSDLIMVEEFPLLSNGKLDYKSLVNYIPEEKEVIAPENEVEDGVLAIWKAILGNKTISTEDRFHEIGGNSLSIMNLIGKINKSYGVRISLSQLFENASIKKQAAFIAKATKVESDNIPKYPGADDYALSSAQNRLHFLHEFDNTSLAFNLAQVCKIEGELDRGKLTEVFKKLIARHESLRIYFELVGDTPRQKVAQDLDFEIEYHEATETEVSELIKQFIRPFDLKEAPLFRVGLIKLAPTEHMLMIDLHHIISDGMSEGILIRDFMHIYTETPLPELRIQYTDYAEWQKEESQQKLIAGQKDFWVNEFSDTPEPLKLPTDFPRPIVKTYEGEILKLKLEESLTQGLKDIAEQENTTLYMLLLALFNVLMSKISNQEDIVLATPIAGRRNADLENLVGLFANTIPLRNYPKTDLSFKDFLSKVKTNTLSCFDNQDYPYETLVDDLSLERDTSRNPLFDVMFAYQNFEETEWQISELKVSPYELEQGVSKLDLSIFTHNVGDSIQLNFEYSTRLFKPETIRRFMGYFEEIVHSILKNKAVSLGEINFIPEAEKTLLLDGFNDTKLALETGQNIVSLFEAMADQKAAASALTFGDHTLSYQQLNERSNQLARKIQALGIEKEARIGVCLDRSPALIESLLGVLKAGCTYVPIDPTYPFDRINYIVEDSQLALMISEAGLEEKRQHFSKEIPVLDVHAEDFSTCSPENLQISISSDQLAYVIYTSGSTGKPKGVMISHANIQNFVSGISERISAQDCQSILGLTTVSFDIFVLETWYPLLRGKHIVLASSAQQKDPAALAQLIQESKLDIVQITPSHLKSLLNSGKGSAILENLKVLMVGGEAFPDALLKQVQQNYSGKIYNMYGPTETTVWSTVQELTDAEEVNIGTPLANTYIRIINERGELQALGVVGELCIGGLGVGRGYWNNEELSAERFIEDPIQEGERIYRTGDMARWLPDGNIDFRGRDDNQVKIRGFRIELGEIESQLSQHPNIGSAAVVLREKEGEKYLMGFYEAAQEFTHNQLRDFLGKALPSYMIPAHFMHLNKLPLTPNGKLDRNALPELEIEKGEDYLAPSNPLESKLVNIWAEVLGLESDKIGVNRSFFELGGHSLNAMSLSNRIFEILGVRVALSKIFLHQDIQSFCQYLLTLNRTGYSSIAIAPEQEDYVLSSAQRRLYFLYEFDEASLAYNGPHFYKIEGNLDYDQLQIALDKVLDRHEILRSSFKLNQGIPRQKIAKSLRLEVERFESDSSNVADIIKDFIRPFDLSQAPPIRVGVIKISSEEHMLLMDIHHIVSDGMSEGILFKDFMDFYQGKHLPELNIQYKDYAEWQAGETQQAIVAEQKEFWLSEFAETPEPLTLATDFTRPKHKSYEGSMLSLTLGKEKTQALQALAEEEGITMFMLLLATFNVFISRLSGQKDVVVATPIAGRGHADLEHMVGLFANTIPLRNYPQSDLSFKDFLSEVKSNTLSCFDNQDYPYETLVDDLSLERDTSRNPLFDVMFAYQNFEETAWQISELTVNPYELEQGVSKLDLSIFTHNVGNSIQLNFEYSTRLFKPETIRRFMGYFEEVVNSILKNKAVSLGEIKFIPETEEAQLLHGFNDTKLALEQGENIVSLFEAMADQKAAALTFGDHTLSYQQLNERSNQLARKIQALGIEKEARIGVCLDRSPLLIESLLGVLKAGCTYVPIDPTYPFDRINYILEDSQLSLLISEAGIVDKRKGFSTHIALLDIGQEDLSSYGNENLETSISSDQLAYVIYTSGSTGKPKGVMITHGNVQNFVSGISARIPLQDCNSILGLTTVSFDIFVLETWYPLLTGKQIVLASSTQQKDPAALAQLIEESKLDIVQITPSHLKSLLNSGKGRDILENLKVLMVGGEAFPDSLLKQVQQNYSGKIYNMYGPTETTVWSTVQELTDAEAVNIGTPLANTYIRIINERGALQALGVVGELCIGGLGVGRGYWNNERLSAERFIEDPMQKGERIYRTGDMAKWLSDGNLDFRGRDDNQVKIRGFRIELGEIESQLSQHANIGSAAVVLREKEGEKYLMGFYESAEAFTHNQLRDFLGKTLPSYMIPAHFMHMEKLPMTPNGKLDRKALPELEIEQGADYLAPSNPLESKLVDIWAEVLGLENDKIGVNRSFFELGGHSLKAMSLANRIFEVLGVKIALKTLFEHFTIKSLSEVLEDAQKREYVAIEKAEDRPHYPLSAAQQGMYFLHQFEPQSLIRNLSNVLRVSGPLDRERLHQTFQKLVDRHESLRTSFHLHEGEVVQKIQDVLAFDLAYFESNNGNTASIIKQFIQPFDLEKAPLLRAGIIQIEPEVHILMLDLHHLIADGLSIQVLENEFISLYKEENLDDPKFQYRDYVSWQNSDFYQEKIAKQEAYWKDIFKEEIKPLEVPVDINAEFEREAKAEVVNFSIETDELTVLNKIAAEQGLTPSMILLAIFKILLSKLSRQEDIMLGVPVSGREQKELEGIVGMFANMLPIRTFPKSSFSYKEYLREVKTCFLAALENQSYPYENLAQELQVVDPDRRNPWFDVSFLYQHDTQTELKFAGLDFEAFDWETDEQNFPNLNLVVSEHGESLSLSFNYSTALFTEDVVRRFMRYYKRIFKLLTEDIHAKISDLELVQGEERQKLLFGFNDTEKELNRQDTFSQLFEQQAYKTPERIAVEHNGRQLNYSALHEKSLKVSTYLQNQAVPKESRIGIFMPRGIDMLVSILGTLEAGAAYVPLDIFYPRDRVKEILSDAQIEIILTTEESFPIISEWINTLSHKVSLLRVDTPEIDSIDIPEERAETSTDDLAYMIYTSGTTGKPKGVMIHQLGMINHLYAKVEDLGLTDEDVVAQTASPCFDISVWQYLVALIVGAKTHIIDREKVLDPDILYTEVVNGSISILESVPSLMHTFLDELRIENNELNKKLRWMLSTGEPLHAGLVKKWYDKYPEIPLLNAYGPTEASDDITHYEVPQKELLSSGIPIGKPVQNTRIYIMDKDMKISPIGIRGEVCVSGIGVGKGYWQSPDKTQKAFVENPYQEEVNSTDHALLYKTGDIGYYREDGNIICLGRLDHQVKIRGNRIELGEIENRLESFEAIRAAAVLVKGSEQNKYLLAYYVAEVEISKEEIITFLKAYMPDYMIPSTYVRMDQMPLTPNGKLDRKSLPDREEEFQDEYIEPETEIEKDLAEIWSQILQQKYERISTGSNFFQIGGNSLSAVTLVNRIHQKFNVKIPLKDFFTNPTIKATATYLQTYLWLNDTPSTEVASRKVRI